MLGIHLDFPVDLPVDIMNASTAFINPCQLKAFSGPYRHCTVKGAHQPTQISQLSQLSILDVKWLTLFYQLRFQCGDE